MIATGGFEWDPDLVRAFSRGPLARSASVPTNTGDGLKMAMRVGAQLGNMREAWWVPIIDVPVGDRIAGWQVNGERTRPHSIMVNKLGKRFTNEAANYNALGAAFHVIDVSTFDYVNHPAWLVYDRHYLTRYGLAGFKGAGPTPGWMTEAETLEDLAQAIGVPVDALQATVARWNEQSERAQGRRLRARQQRPRPLVGRPEPRRRPAGDDGPAGHRALLRRAGLRRRARHQGRPAHQR